MKLYIHKHPQTEWSDDSVGQGGEQSSQSRSHPGHDPRREGQWLLVEKLLKH